MHPRIKKILALMAPLCGAVALTAFGGYVPSAAAEQPAAAVRDGSHDFDFLKGTWLMHNRRLKQRLAGSHEWAEFDSTDENRPLPGGLGNEDVFRTDFFKKGFVGLTVRIYDPATGLWSLYWSDNISYGSLNPPQVGKFDGNVGIFDCHDTFNGKPVIIRYTWTVLDKDVKDGKVVAHFEQSFSPDDGKTWEVNFANDLIRTGDGSASW